LQCDATGFLFKSLSGCLSWDDYATVFVGLIPLKSEPYPTGFGEKASCKGTYVIEYLA
jgi:hypothetical protein